MSRVVYVWSNPIGTSYYFCEPHAGNVAFNCINVSTCLASFTFEPNSLAIHMIPRRHPWNLLCLKAFLSTIFCVEFIHVIESLFLLKRHFFLPKAIFTIATLFVFCLFMIFEYPLITKQTWELFWNPVNRLSEFGKGKKVK